MYKRQIDNWVKNNWKRGKSGPVKNIDLWERLLKAIEPHRVTFCWVKGPVSYTHLDVYKRQGYTMEEAMKEVKMVVEGVYSAKAALKLSEKYEIDMPIVEQVNAILFDDKPASEAVKGLMLRDKTIESSDLPW